MKLLATLENIGGELDRIEDEDEAKVLRHVRTQWLRGNIAGGGKYIITLQDVEDEE